MPEIRPTIAVVDSQWVGSLPSFHCGICRALLSNGCRVISYSPDPASVECYAREQGSVEKDAFVALPLLPAAGSRVAAFMRRISLSLLVRVSPERANACRAREAWTNAAFTVAARGSDLAPELVFFPYLDAPLLAGNLAAADVERLFPFAWSGLLLSPVWLRGGDPRVAGPRLSAIRSRRCVAIALLDEGLQEAFRHELDSKPVLVMPDFTDDRIGPQSGALERQIRQTTQGRFTVGLIGELSSRKGIGAFLDTAQLARERGLDWRFVMAGPLNRKSAGKDANRLNRQLSAAASNCILFEGRIPDGHEFNAVVRALSVVWAVYPEFRHSSNMLTKAALMRRPVITHEGYLLAERVRSFHLGEVAPANDPERILASLQQIVARTIDTSRAFERYYAQHSQQRLVEMLRELLTHVRRG